MFLYVLVLFQMINSSFENTPGDVDPIDPREKEEALAFVRAIFGQVAVLGRNDSEFGDLRNIEEKLMGGVITPEEAKRAAQAVYDRKQEH